MSRVNHLSFPEEEKTTYFAFERRMFSFLFDQGRHFYIVTYDNPQQ